MKNHGATNTTFTVMENMGVNGAEPPEHLSPAAKDLWQRYMLAYEILDEGGRSLLEVLVVNYERALEAQRDIQERGQVYADRFGQPRPNPSVKIYNDASHQVMTAIRGLKLDIQPGDLAGGRPVR